MRATKGMVEAGLGCTVFSYAGMYEEVDAGILKINPEESADLSTTAFLHEPLHLVIPARNAPVPEEALRKRHVGIRELGALPLSLPGPLVVLEIDSLPHSLAMNFSASASLANAALWKRFHVVGPAFAVPARGAPPRTVRARLTSPYFSRHRQRITASSIAITAPCASSCRVRWQASPSSATRPLVH